MTELQLATSINLRELEVLNIVKRLIQANQAEILQTLIQNGRLQIDPESDNVQTFVGLALRYNATECLELLAENQVQFSNFSPAQVRKIFLPTMAEKGWLILKTALDIFQNEKTLLATTLLPLAASLGNEKACRVLLNSAADPLTESGKAFSAASQNGHVNILKQLESYVKDTPELQNAYITAAYKAAANTQPVSLAYLLPKVLQNSEFSIQKLFQKIRKFDSLTPKFLYDTFMNDVKAANSSEALKLAIKYRFDDIAADLVQTTTLSGKDFKALVSMNTLNGTETLKTAVIQQQNKNLKTTSSIFNLFFKPQTKLQAETYAQLKELLKHELKITNDVKESRLFKGSRSKASNLLRYVINTERYNFSRELNLAAFEITAIKTAITSGFITSNLELQNIMTASKPAVLRKL